MRGISKERMIVLLQDIPSGAFLTTNVAGNFKIHYNGKFYGYIDVNDKKIVLAENLT